jgi:hypothetical protein
MEPFDFQARVRARLIEFKRRDMGPINLSDVVAFPEAKRRDRFLVRSADKKTHEKRDLDFFPSGAKLRFEVLFEKIEKAWTITRYSLHFDRDGRWFRYDLDPDRAKGQKHPLAHLHVNSKEPRYPTNRFENPLEFLDFLDEQGFLTPSPSSG